MQKRSIISIQQMLELSPGTIAQEQNKLLTQHAIGILKRVISHLEKKEYEDINYLIQPAASTSSYKPNRCFINFCFTGSQEGDDINDLVGKLRHLDEIGY